MEQTAAITPRSVTQTIALLAIALAIGWIMAGGLGFPLMRKK